MTKNIGSTERVIRGVIGVALIVSAAIGAFAPWGWIGVVPLVTALIGWCPPYAILGISTCKTKAS